jgi:Mn2+/Fe2+ NRAMP family transporter
LARDQRFLQVLGPGILFAGTAIGVSHLVQSTRAGALYGLGMLLVVVLVNALKYPAFRLAPHYAAVTGESLVHGYRRRGRWLLVLYGIALLPTLATVVAAVAITMAGLALATLAVEGMSPPVLGATFVAGAVALTLAGGFAWLDRLTKLFVAFLTLATLASAALALPRIDWAVTAWLPPEMNAATLVFLVALAGYMPAGLDLSVMHSLWCVARARQTGLRPDAREAALDFNVGFVGSLVLALCFLLMGAGVMHPSGVVPEASAAAFAAQVIGLYETTLGAWSGALVGVSAFLVLLTTLLAVTDGFPRVVAAVLLQLHAPDPPGAPGPREATADSAGEPAIDRTVTYRCAMVLIGAGAVLLLMLFLGSFRTFIDTVTTIGFITSPVIALLNHLVAFGPHVPVADRPAPWLRWWSTIGIVAMFAVTIAYLSLSLLGVA